MVSARSPTIAIIVTLAARAIFAGLPPLRLSLPYGPVDKRFTLLSQVTFVEETEELSKLLATIQVRAGIPGLCRGLAFPRVTSAAAFSLLLPGLDLGCPLWFSSPPPFQEKDGDVPEAVFKRLKAVRWLPVNELARGRAFALCCDRCGPLSPPPPPCCSAPPLTRLYPISRSRLTARRCRFSTSTRSSRRCLVIQVGVLRL